MNAPSAEAPVLEVNGLVKHFGVTRGLVNRKVIGLVRAVEDVSFEIARGETLALVGESGCGKSTTGRLILRLMDPTSGSVRFKGKEIATLDLPEPDSPTSASVSPLARSNETLRTARTSRPSERKETERSSTCSSGFSLTALSGGRTRRVLPHR
jgi:ABC-type oligopeptide transport system ATPase subunit